MRALRWLRQRREPVRRMRARYHWQCLCGASSRRPGFLIESDAEYAAWRHETRPRPAAVTRCSTMILTTYEADPQ